MREAVAPALRHRRCRSSRWRRRRSWSICGRTQRRKQPVVHDGAEDRAPSAVHHVRTVIVDHDAQIVAIVHTRDGNVALTVNEWRAAKVGQHASQSLSLAPIDGERPSMNQRQLRPRDA